MRCALFALALLLGGCGYFNAMYNAQRRFGDAERAAARGDVVAAESAWRDAIDRAAISFRGDPDGRWSDDALLLVGRAHFGLGSHEHAAAALEHALRQSRDAGLRAQAHLWLGATRVELGAPAAALASLDSALLLGDNDADVARTRLWRGRALRALDRHAAAWADFEAASAARAPVGVAAALDMAAAAIAAGDSARFADAALRALRTDAAFAADSVTALANAAAHRWTADFGRSVLLRTEPLGLPDAVHDRLRLERALLAAAAGDRAAAFADAHAAAAGRGSDSDRARIWLARWTLHAATGPDGLGAARALLLPSLADGTARALHGSIARAEGLLERAASPDGPLALYAAAELARDELAAPTLAAGLFLAYVDRVPAAEWAAKAALAAAALGADRTAVDARLHGLRGSVYIAALEGRADSAAFAAAERRLAAALAPFRAAATPADGAAAAVVALDSSARADGAAVARDTLDARSP